MARGDRSPRDEHADRIRNALPDLFRALHIDIQQQIAAVFGGSLQAVPWSAVEVPENFCVLEKLSSLDHREELLA